MNAIECLDCIDELRKGLGAIQAGMKIEAARIASRIRLPATWLPDWLFEAHQIAMEISKAVDSWPTPSRTIILRKIGPLVEMYRRRYNGNT